MIPSQVNNAAFDAVRAALASTDLLRQFAQREVDFRGQLEAPPPTGGPAAGAANLVYAVAADGRVYAIDPTVTPSRRIDTTPLPQRQAEQRSEPLPSFNTGAIPSGGLFSSLIQLSSAQMAEIFGEPGSLALSEEYAPLNDNLQSAATSEPVRAAQFVSSFAKALPEAAPEPVKAKAATAVASFYAALGNTPLLVTNLIDIAA